MDLVRLVQWPLGQTSSPGPPPVPPQHVDVPTKPHLTKWIGAFGTSHKDPKKPISHITSGAWRH